MARRRPAGRPRRPIVRAGRRGDAHPPRSLGHLHVLSAIHRSPQSPGGRPPRRGVSLWPLRGDSRADRLAEPRQMAVGVRRRELTNAVLDVAGAMPALLRRQDETRSRRLWGCQERRHAIDPGREVRAPPQRSVERRALDGRHAAPADLVDHQLRPAEVRKANPSSGRAPAGDLEAQHVAVEGEADPPVGDGGLRNRVADLERRAQARPAPSRPSTASQIAPATSMPSKRSSSWMPVGEVTLISVSHPPITSMPTKTWP